MVFKKSIRRQGEGKSERKYKISYGKDLLMQKEKYLFKRIPKKDLRPKIRKRRRE